MGKEHTLIILAAGDGGRLGQQKVLLEFGGRTLLEHIIDAFFDYVKRIVIVVGYEAHQIISRIGHYEEDVPVNYVLNWEWAETKTGDSLLAAREHWEGKPCVVVSGDHLFGPKLADQIMAHCGTCVLADGNVDNLDGEETVLIGNEGGTVKELIFPAEKMTFQRDFLRGECPEVFKFSARDTTKFLSKHLEGNDVFEAVNWVSCVRWFHTDEPWIEIDTPEDLERAQGVWAEIESGD